MKAFETDKKELLNKVQDVIEDYMEIKETEDDSISLKRELRQLRKMIVAVEKWKEEL